MTRDAATWPLPAAGSRTAAPASWRPRTRWRRSALGAAHGYRAFECDVKLSADGVPFLLHDATLERTTTGRGIAGDATWAELSRLDAGGWHSPRLRRRAAADAGRASPRYCMRNGFALNIEIKPTPGVERGHRPAWSAPAARAVGRRSALPPLLSSFQPEALQARARRGAAAAARAAARHAVRRLARDARARSAASPSSPTTADGRRAASTQLHAAGLRGAGLHRQRRRPTRSGCWRSASTASSPTRSTASHRLGLTGIGGRRPRAAARGQARSAPSRTTSASAPSRCPLAFGLRQASRTPRITGSRQATSASQQAQPPPANSQRRAQADVLAEPAAEQRAGRRRAAGSASASCSSSGPAAARASPPGAAPGS